MPHREACDGSRSTRRSPAGRPCTPRRRTRSSPVRQSHRRGVRGSSRRRPRAVRQLPEDERAAVRDLEREGVAADVVEGVDDLAIRYEIPGVIGMRVDGDAVGLPELYVEAVDDVRTVAEDGIGAAAAAPADD